LDLHPDISMSAVKELRFFSNENWDRGIDWYESHFRMTTPIRGESSPEYTRYPVHPNVPERMVSIVPDVKLIYLVRDPIERLHSQYRYMRFSLRGQLPPLDDHLRAYAESPIVAQSRYAYQLDRYLAQFPLSQILVVDASELEHNRLATLQRIFAFLDVRTDFTSPGFDRRYNETAGLQPNLAGRVLLQAERKLGLRGSQLVRRHAPARLTRVLSHTPEIPVVRVDPVLLAEVEAFLREDVQRLMRITGLRFDSWPILADTSASRVEPAPAAQG
jgi:hypothetical protein